MGEEREREGGREREKDIYIYIYREREGGIERERNRERKRRDREKTGDRERQSRNFNSFVSWEWHSCCKLSRTDNISSTNDVTLINSPNKPPFQFNTISYTFCLVVYFGHFDCRISDVEPILIKQNVISNTIYSTCSVDHLFKCN